MGNFIVFEGTEGSGKSTVINSVETALMETYGLSVSRYREPGATRVAEAVRSILFDFHQELNDITELLLFESARATLLPQISEDLSKGNWVICDRHKDSTIVYQGILRGVDRGIIDKLNEIAVQGCNPDLTIILLTSYETAVERMGGRNDGGKYDDLDKHGFDTIANGYRSVAEEDPEGHVVIDASGTPEEVFQAVMKEITSRFLTAA